MQNSQGSLFFSAGIDLVQWKKDIETMRRDILGLNNTVKNETRQIDSSFKNLSLGIAGYFSANAIIGFAKELIDIRGEFQKTEIAFSTMLGDGVQAKNLMGQMVDLAAKTPFSLQDVSNGAKQLLAFQVPANEVVDTLTRMGNIAAGLSVPLSRINLVYGQVRAKGKLMGDDLRQFTEAGIPMVAELAKKFNKTTAEVSAMVSAGKVGFKDVKDVLFSLTNEGGMFFNLMEKQSASLSGKIANLGDTWDQMMNTIGESNEGLLADGIDGLSYLVEHYEEVGRVLKTLIEVYGAYRVALALTAAMQGRMATPALIQGFSNLIKIIRGATVAQATLNATTLANPYILLATGIAAVVAVCYNYREELGQLVGIIDKATEKTKYQETVDKQFTKTFSQGIVEKRSKIETLIAVINNENSKLDDRKRAYEKLIAIDATFRNTLDNQYRSTLRLGDAFDHVIKKMQAMAMAQAEIAVKAEYLQKKAQADFDVSLAQVKYDEGERQLKEWAKLLNQGKIDVKEYAKRVDEIGWDKTRRALNEAKKAQAEITKETNYANKAEENKLKTLKQQETILLAQLKGGKVQGKPITDGLRAKMKKDLDIIQAQLGEYAKKIEETVSDGATPKLGIIEKLQEELKAINEAIDKELDEKNLPALRSKRDFLKKRIDELLGTKGKSEKQLAEFLPSGSIKELQQRAQLIQEAADVAVNGLVKLRKLDKYGKDKDKNGNPYLTGEVISSQQAFEQIQAINDKVKELQIKSFDEQTAELERRIKIRDQIIQSGYSKEVADSMFPDLAGKDLLKSLQSLQADINVKISSGKATKGDAENYTKISTTIDTLLGKQSLLDKFNNDTDKALAKLTTATDQISYLRDLQSKMSDADISNGFYSFAEENIRKIIQAQERSYQDLLIEHQTYEDQRIEIDKQATAKRIEILNDPQLTPEKKAKLTESVTKQQSKQTSESALDELENSGAWEMLYQNIDSLTAYQIDKLLMALDEKKDLLSAKMTPIDLRNVINKLRGAKQQLIAQNPFQGMVTSFKLAIKGFGAETEEETQIAQENFEDAATAVKSTYQKIGDAAGALEPFKDVLGDFGAEALNAIIGFATSAITVALLTKTTLAAIKTAIKTGEWSSVILAILQIIMIVIKAVVSLISWLWKMGDKKKEKQIKSMTLALGELKVAYEAVAYAAEKAFGSQKYDADINVIKNLEEQQRQLEDMYKKEDDKKKSDKGKLTEYKSQIQAIGQQIQDLQDKMVEDVLQTSVKDAAKELGDALVEAFEKGENAAKSMEKVANDVLKNLLKNQLNLMLQNRMKPILDNLLAASGFNADGTGSFNGLSPEEIAKFKADVLQAGNDMQGFLGAYSDIFSGLKNDDTLSGAIKGVTEETAGVIAGQMNAIRMAQAESLIINRESSNILRNSLLQLTQIEFNTRNLLQIRVDISQMNSKMKSGLAGIG